MLTISAYGHLGADPSLRYSNNGSVVASLRLGVSTGKDQTTWLDCSVWGKRAQVCADYMKKGDGIAITGRGRLDTFARRDGTQGASLSVDVQDFSLPARNGRPAQPSYNAVMAESPHQQAIPQVQPSVVPVAPQAAPQVYVQPGA